MTAAWLVNGCDTTPVREEPGREQSEPAETAPAVEAIPLEDGSPGIGLDPDISETDPSAAIRSDLRRGRNALPPYRQSAYLDAADKLVATGRFEAANELLDRIDTAGLAPVLIARKRLLRAEMDFQRGQTDRAMRLVDRNLRLDNIDPTYVSRSLDLKARIDLRRGRPLEAARSWMRRYQYLSDPEAVDGNNERVWDALGHLNELDLQLAGQTGAGELLRGWLDLAILFLEFSGDRHGLRVAVTRWRDANRAHPAADFAGALLGPERAADVRQVALLLPLSSNFGAAARSVYDGFEAAHGSDSDPRRPQLLFYDIGGESAFAANYAGVAVSEGADVIVGPLGKAAVNDLLSSREPPGPMVLLGSASVSGTAPADTYQFDLAPEPEARQVAEFMYLSGHRRLGLLYPDDEWGQRVYEAFTDHWRTLGGTLAEAHSFDPNVDDHTDVIKNLFNLTESETRRAVLENTVGLNLKLDARRRQDIDALFMAARPEEARLLKPQINFFQGLGLPVYSTSHVYAGSPDAVKDTDLDGIRFPDMPWVLRNTARMTNLKRQLAEAGAGQAADGLFAFGYDAYALALLATSPDRIRSTPLRGLTAELVVGRDGRVHRDMDWAEFRNGVPVKVWKP